MFRSISTSISSRGGWVFWRSWDWSIVMMKACLGLGPVPQLFLIVRWVRVLWVIRVSVGWRSGWGPEASSG